MLFPVGLFIQSTLIDAALYRGEDTGRYVQGCFFNSCHRT